MTAKFWKPSFDLMQAHEGGYVNHPLDPGGATNRGVIQRTYDAYRKLHGLPVQSVKLIADLEVQAIYKNQYWNLVRGDSLPAGLDYAVFDFAVNSGVSRATRYLQRLVGVDDDGVIGDISLVAIYQKARENEEDLIIQYCANRMVFLRSLSTFKTFGTGWTRRVIGYTDGVQDSDSGVIDYGIKFANGDDQYIMPSAIGSNPDEIPAKAIPEDKDFFPVYDNLSLPEFAQLNDKLNSIITKQSV